MLPKKEFVIANGLGGYVSSTLSGLNTRKYHGLFIVADSHLDRHIYVAQILERILFPDDEIALTSVGFKDETLAPDGSNTFDSFTSHPRTTIEFKSPDVTVTKIIDPLYGTNEVKILYVIQSSIRVDMQLQPLLTDRNIYEVKSSANLASLSIAKQSNNAFTFQTRASDVVTIYLPKAVFSPKRELYYNVYYERDEMEGLPSTEDLVSLGYFTYTIQPGLNQIEVIISSRNHTQPPSMPHKVSPKAIIESFYSNAKIERRKRLDEIILSSDKFIISVKGRRSIIAGYHWFKDWGRDTFISFYGLLILTKRFTDAREIIQTWADAVKYGLIPNRLHDDDYGTIDGTLWFVKAIWDYYEATKDTSLLTDVYGTLLEVFDSHLNGTLFGIGVNSNGFLEYTDSSMALTWMDAKIDGVPVIDRSGSAVEIQGLWYNALVIMMRIESILRKSKFTPALDKYKALIESNFLDMFYNASGSYLYDRVQHGKQIDELRPNQLLVMSLNFPLVSREAAQTILPIIEEQLLTSRGLKTLNSSHPLFQPLYRGDMHTRDRAYHQGTIWPWLLGPFVHSYIKAFPQSKEVRVNAKHLLDEFIDEIAHEHGADIPEIFEAETLEPRGCIAQAWSVAQVLEGYSVISR